MHFKVQQGGKNRANGTRFIRLNALSAAVPLGLCLMLNSWCIPAQAGDPAFNNAIKTFSSGKYAQALAQFQVVAQKYPSDPLTRYYMGLCYQQLNQVGQAQSMYTWVERNARSNDLKAKARAGLDSMNQYSAGRSHPGASSAPPPPPEPGDAKAADPKAGDTKKAEVKPEAKGAMKCKKVIQFTSSTSNEQRQIQMFAPYWEEASTKFRGKVDFQMVDVDSAGPGAELAKKYNVSQMPFVVYLDKDGKMLSSSAGASGDITSTIEGFK